jgi:adenylate cyclase
MDVAVTPAGSERAVAYVEAADGSVIASMIGYDRFGRLLGEIPVGRTGRSYVLGPDGAIVIAGHAEEAPRLSGLDTVAVAAGRIIAARPDDDKNVLEKARVEVDGAGYAVGLSPLWFQGWQLAVIVPEAEFLGPIDQTIRNIVIGLTGFILLASALAIAAARWLVAVPMARVVDDLGHVERFELERVPRRHSRLREIDRVSEAIVRMSTSLADFGKFIPTDLVRSLLADGMRAEPGGSRREITLLFADLAGFTALSERLGDGIVPVLSAYLDVASQAVAAEHGTVDKFIGDAVIAFWGAPGADPAQARHACRCALAIASSVERIQLPPDVEHDLRVRIGLHSGPAVVGNVGSMSRLNYTALGDTVNLASRLEGLNKIYGTTILLGSATREAAGESILVREIDTVAVYGRLESVTIFELVGLTKSSRRPDWITAYEDALALYRTRRYAQALDALQRVAQLRPDDGPAERLAATCRQLLAHPPGVNWRPVTTLDIK